MGVLGVDLQELAQVGPRSMDTISVRGVITSRTCRSPNRNTFSSISASTGSKVPSASPISMRVRNSPSVMDLLAEELPPRMALVPRVVHWSTTTSGSISSSTHFRGRA